MEFYEFFCELAVVVFTYLLTSLLFITVVFFSQGYHRGFTSLDILFVSTQLIGLGCIVGIPLMVYFLSQFKVVRRE